MAVSIELYWDFLRREVWNVSEEKSRAVLQQYKEEHANQPYHNLSHVLQMLQFVAIKGLEHASTYHANLERTLFHDFAHVPGSTTSEEFSFEAWCRYRKMLDLDPPSELDWQAISLTKKHTLQQEEVPKYGVFIDADLSILASNPQDYDRYAQAIREEYLPISGSVEEYLDGRISFLRNMLSRKKIFYVSSSKMKKRAKLNMQRELESLRDEKMMFQVPLEA